MLSTPYLPADKTSEDKSEAYKFLFENTNSPWAKQHIYQNCAAFRLLQESKTAEKYQNVNGFASNSTEWVKFTPISSLNKEILWIFDNSVKSWCQKPRLEFSHEDDNDILWRDESESKLVCDFNSIKFGRIISEYNTVKTLSSSC